MRKILVSLIPTAGASAAFHGLLLSLGISSPWSGIFFWLILFNLVVTYFVMQTEN